MLKYGLIGKKLGHSFSKKWFTEQFRNLKIDAEYQNFELEEISQIHNLISCNNLLGFNVTIPYKTQIINTLDYIDKEALAVGAVNTVKVNRKTGNRIILNGYNTDILGFEFTLNSINIPDVQALILGDGGAAQAVKYVLKKKQIDFQTVSRNNSELTYKNITFNHINDNKLIINTTPLGMFPNIYAKPQIPYEAITNKHILIDLIYNPKNTEFLKTGQQFGANIINGEMMLYKQADEALKIWLKDQ